MKNFDTLIKTIQRQALNADEHTSAQSSGWKLPRDRIVEILDLDIRDVYTQIQRSNDPMVSFSTSQYGDENSGALVSILETIGYSDASSKLWKAGIFIPVEMQIELQRRIIETAEQLLDLHHIYYENFLAMYDSFPHLDEAFNLYISEYFSWGDIRDEAIGNLVDAHHETTAVLILPRLVTLADELYRRGLIPNHEIFHNLFEKLLAYLVQNGRIRPQSYSENHNTATKEVGTEKNWALETMGFSNSDFISPGELKQRYKELMKRYHPDRNPSGLEKTKKINRAFAVLNNEN